MGIPRTLGAFPYRRVRVTCVWCPRRRGDYDTERMVARLGAGASLEAVLVHVTRTCPRPKAWTVRGPNQYLPWCRAVLDDVWHGRPPDRITGSQGPGIP
ncbi:hypothetical protein GCM10007886_32430 [Methylobacterium gregans]|jgi:hypothetical protein|uniref:Uncharacterized protein n=1 Tax=Methylobacterium gregans TaxID=374424 RepID=A0AA37HT64_9HYPH|nr:hypothetical protein [Methylobacterium gregans]GJD81458.1 hypothetical protein NBEOAGPD_4707 [Methylobacterium gregans]GLS55059.1 hypothetical protein GCM10007886_32430 [Methylobacterium gregans]